MTKKLLQISWMATTVFLWSFHFAIAAGSGSTSGYDPNNVLFQSTIITGKVTDEAGAGMPGVNIVVKGTTSGTTTDSDGVYSLSVSGANPVLVFSFIGYTTQEVVVNNRSSISVTMAADIQSLSEVVVVGYGTQRKRDVTGSMASVNEQQLKDVPVSNLVEGLQGRAAGVDIQKGGGNSKPGAAPVIRIRGVRSLQAGNDPLFVVDGIPFNGSITDLNQDDIVSVEVLKDASATAIYGSRGANGVILVTTKRGKAGAPVITYNGYHGFVKTMGKFDIMNGQQFADLKKWSRINGQPAGTYSGLDDPKFLDPNDATFDPQEKESIQLGRSTDWQDLIYKTGIMTNHQLSVSGGTERNQYSISTGYFNETGIYPGQGFERYSIKLSIDQELSKHLRIGLSTLNNFTLRTGENSNPMGQVLRASPLATPYDEKGQLWGFLPGSANQVWNPLADFVDGAVEENRKRLGTFTTLYLEAKLVEGLKYRFNAGAEVRSDVYGRFYGSATSYNLGTDNSARNRTRMETNYTLENLLLYEKVIAEKHRVNFTGLFSLQESEMRNNLYDSRGILADYLQFYSPEFATVSTSGSGEYEKWDILSYMGRINYGFDDRYLLTLTMRSDGSSVLAPGNKYKMFPSAAIGWNIKEEQMMANVTAITSLKLRASYGRVGNAAIDPYTVLGRLSPVNYNYKTQNGEDVLVTGVYPTHAPNAELEWEYTATRNIGLDFGLLQNRITGTVEAYHQLTDKLLLRQTLPPTSGIPNAVHRNIGKTENKGIEVQISTVNIKGDGRDKLSWTTDFNFFINRGKITQLFSGVERDINNAWFVGQPIGTIFDYKKIGIWQNTPEDSAQAKSMGMTVTGVSSVIGTIRVADLSGPEGTPDNRITPDDRTIIGNSQPKWLGGFTSRLAYKGIDFTVVAFGRYGSTLVSAMHNSGFANTYQGNYNNLVTDYWTPTNGQNTYPKPNQASTNTPYNSTLGYFDGSYLKVRSLSLGYSFPSSIISRIGASSARVYTTVNDAFILFSPYRNKYNGLDPEAINTSTGSDGNRQRVAVDTPASYSVIFGLNLTF